VPPLKASFILCSGGQSFFVWASAWQPLPLLMPSIITDNGRVSAHEQHCPAGKQGYVRLISIAGKVSVNQSNNSRGC
jgi:hypothetical protein